MSEFLDILQNQQKLKASVKALSVAKIKAIRQMVLDAIAQKKIIENLEHQRRATQLAKILEIRQLMKSSGVSIEELNKTFDNTVTVKHTSLPKYFIEVAGKTITWTGKGRMPDAFKQRLKKGHCIEEYKI